VEKKKKKQSTAGEKIKWMENINNTCLEGHPEVASGGPKSRGIF